jgi:hypothetical protein
MFVRCFCADNSSLTLNYQIGSLGSAVTDHHTKLSEAEFMMYNFVEVSGHNLRLEVFLYHVYITNQIQTIFSQRGKSKIC